MCLQCLEGCEKQRTGRNIWWERAKKQHEKEKESQSCQLESLKAAKSKHNRKIYFFNLNIIMLGS